MAAGLGVPSAVFTVRGQEQRWEAGPYQVVAAGQGVSCMSCDCLCSLCL